MLNGNINKIKSKLRWQPEYSFKQLVELMIEKDLQELSKQAINPSVILTSGLG